MNSGAVTPRVGFPGTLEPWLREALQSWGVKELTDIQLRAHSAGITTGSSMIVCSPTSSGKTMVAEMALLSALRAGRRAVYLVSHKALAEQKFADFGSKFGEQASHPIASVGLSTGDHTEGARNADLCVVTYEKALGLVMTGEIKLPGTLIVADELQIIADPKRGPDIEVLCTVLRQRKPAQFVALTATVQNPEILARWFECRVIRSTDRVVPLHQEIWYASKRWLATFGEPQAREVAADVPITDIHAVVRTQIESGRGPVLVFTESRREAAELAQEFGATRQITADGIALSEQLDLFTEPTDSSGALRAGAERRVAFHSADLSAQERQIVEDGFSRNRFEVCFATSTLAAGVNFPFRSIVFPKLTYEYGERKGTRIARTDYRNMSGRAGRLGLHPEGHAILLPRSTIELEHAKMLVKPEDDSIASQLGKISLRKSVLGLVASRIVASESETVTFFESTLLYAERTRFTDLPGDISRAFAWLRENALIIDQNGGGVAATALGRAAAQSGLLPDSAVHLAAMLKEHGGDLEAEFEGRSSGLVYLSCACEEFCGTAPSRNLPFPARGSYDSIGFWRGKAPWIEIDGGDPRLAQSAHAIQLFCDGVEERHIMRSTGVSAGNVHRLAADVAWVLDGMHRLSCVPDLGCSQSLSNRIAALARRVRWGAPADALDIIRLSERHRVPGLGRQRAMALVAAGIETLQKVLETPVATLARLVHGIQRAKALVAAVSETDGVSRNSLAAQHHRVAESLGVGPLVDECERANGTAYEDAVIALLREVGEFTVTHLDDGSRQNVPDILLTWRHINILLECKTCTRKPQMIGKEDAWAVVQKAANFDSGFRRATLGKPLFDETSNKKAAAATDITLVEHVAFIEGLLRVLSGPLQPGAFMAWLAAPGIADPERLGGTPTLQL